MKKIKLDLDALSVETFSVEAAPPARGTVAGHADTEDVTCGTCRGFSCGDGNSACVCWPVYPSGNSCYNACDTNWTGADYPSCAPNANCGGSYNGACETLIC